MIVEDFTFHLSHRLLHWKAIYPYIHKVHHEHKVTIAAAANYAHPIEFLFGNVLPTAAGTLILGPKIHITTSLTWYVLRSMESTEGHSGYEFSWSMYRLIPFGSDYAYHVYHHTQNVGNYSSTFTFWDTVFGSNRQYYRYLADLEEEKELEREL